VGRFFTLRVIWVLFLTPSFAQGPPNPGYRVQVYAPAHARLSADQDWILKYRFVVPPLPTSPTWTSNMGTVYQWGDVDFDGYGNAGPYKLSHYRFNQIVPQLVIGNVLDASDANFTPAWDHLRTWHIQAQYYWYDDSNAKSYAQTGPLESVNPGDMITTTIRYDHRAGSIEARIADDNVSGRSSSITIVRPFPNEKWLFASWADFFRRAEIASKTFYVLNTPAVDVETDYLDQQTMCRLLPLDVREISIPGIPLAESSFSVQQLGGFACPQPVVRFAFGNNQTGGPR
jgi:hypothetical protein